MKCQSCGADDAPHELTEVIDGQVQTMRFCADCLPDRVREAVAPALPVAFTRARKQGNDLHIWLSVPAQVAGSQMVLRLSEDVEVTMPAEDGDIFQFRQKASAFRPDCTGDLLVHITVGGQDYDF
ncbi:MAG TPA: hypothetical protein VM141_02065 [Planctomycetota bacterium]|nr:hypothetical protein [Planctomycetota bacterium]